MKGRPTERKREMIAVIAEDSEFFHRVDRALVQASERMGVLLVPVKPPSHARGFKYVITPEGPHSQKIPKGRVLTVKDRDGEEEIVVNFMALLMGGREYREISVGIDPGGRIGAYIMGDGQELWTGVFHSPADVLAFIRPLKRITRSRLYTIKVGDGAPLCRDEIINGLVDLFPIQMVEEEKLPKSENDAESARLIAQTTGYDVRERVDHRISGGEIAKIQERSRIATGRLTISKKLAERVARGEISLERAIELMDGSGNYRNLNKKNRTNQ